MNAAAPVQNEGRAAEPEELCGFLSEDLLPKFVSEVAAMYYELRKRGTGLRMMGRCMDKWNDRDLIVLAGRTFERATVMIRAIGLYPGQGHSRVALRAVRAADQKY
jgi:hypothetical protein